MKSTQLLPLLRGMASLGYGATLGSGVAALICVIVSAHRDPPIPDERLLTICMYSGAAVGTALNTVIDRFLVWILWPVVKYAIFYFRMVEISLLITRGLLTKKRATELIQELAEEHFLGGQPEAAKKAEG